MRKLYFDHNQIEIISSQVDRLKVIESLALSHNKIKSVEVLGKLESLSCKLSFHNIIVVVLDRRLSVCFLGLDISFNVIAKEPNLNSHIRLLSKFSDLSFSRTSSSPSPCHKSNSQRREPISRRKTGPRLGGG